MHIIKKLKKRKEYIALYLDAIACYMLLPPFISYNTWGLFMYVNMASACFPPPRFDL